MIIEKTCEDKYSRDTVFDYVNADQHELTVTITLAEYRELLEAKFEKQRQKEELKWYEQYDRANKAEQRIKELEGEVNALKNMMICPKMEEPKE
jgi:hypothetical protein